MIVTFSYPLPDELFVEGVSGDVTGTYTYDGPETFDVQVNNAGEIEDIDPQTDPENGPDFKITINASENPEVAYLMQHYFVDNYVYEYETEDEILENGDVYKKILNPDLKDAYYPKFNFETNEWELILVVKDQTNPSVIEAKRRKEYIGSYSSKYSFGVDLDSQIENYLEELEEFILSTPPIKSWKYINFNLSEVPKIPYNISIELAKMPNGGL
jgi:hypothetical protein